MPKFSFVLLYVDNPLTSAPLYEKLLGSAPIELSAGFAMFKLSDEVKLGLWSRHIVAPPAQPAFGGAEIAFLAADKDAVQKAYAQWTKAGLRVAQTPVDMAFGFTFTALDPDGHRIRVYAPQ